MRGLCPRWRGKAPIVIRTVAVLGTGIMGAPVARNLLEAGLDVRVWNRTREKAAVLEEDGAAVADTPEDAVAGVDAVLTVLTDGPAVEGVMTGEHRTLEAMGGDSVWIQLSTVGIAAAERLARAAAAAGVAFVDAPVLGTREPAERGELLVLASGPEDVREPCDVVFDAIGKETVWLGPAGAGSRMKVVLNAWLLAVVEGTAETIAFAEAVGLDPALVLEALDGTPIDSPYVQLKGKAMIEGEMSPSFPLRLAVKDADLVLAAAEEAGLELPLQRAVRDRLDRAVELGHGDEDVAAAFYASRA
jgi:3-hydroxyisobutyrate dehydrogenase